jgi:hypothetical protein
MGRMESGRLSTTNHTVEGTMNTANKITAKILAFVMMLAILAITQSTRSYAQPTAGEPYEIVTTVEDGDPTDPPPPDIFPVNFDINWENGITTARTVANAGTEVAEAPPGAGSIANITANGTIIQNGETVSLPHPRLFRWCIRWYFIYFNGRWYIYIYIYRC